MVNVPHPFVAEEHTAQLNDAGQDQAFSRAEWYELRSQDLDFPVRTGNTLAQSTSLVARPQWRLA